MMKPFPFTNYAHFTIRVQTQNWEVWTMNGALIFSFLSATKLSMTISILNFMPTFNGEDSLRYPYNVIFGTGLTFEIESRKGCDSFLPSIANWSTFDNFGFSSADISADLVTSSVSGVSSSKHLEMHDNKLKFSRLTTKLFKIHKKLHTWLWEKKCNFLKWRKINSLHVHLWENEIMFFLDHLQFPTRAHRVPNFSPCTRTPN